MFFSYIFLLRNFHTNGFIPTAAEKLSVIIPVSRQLLEDKKIYIESLHASKIKFCFALTDSDSTHLRNNSYWNSLSTFFFLPNYIKTAGSYVVVLDKALSGHQLTLIDAEKKLQKQGISSLSKNFINTSQKQRSYINDYSYYNHLIASDDCLSTESLGSLFESVLADAGFNKHIIVLVDGEEDYNQKVQFLTKFEEWVAANQKPYLDLFLAYKATNEKLLNLDIENQNLKFRIGNYNDYLNLLRETAIWHVDEYQRIHREKEMAMQRLNSLSHETSYANVYAPSAPPTYLYDNEVLKELDYLRSNRETIINWYTKEYEALPMWYKRFGHVIKVMMGKRSFKSLYK